MYAPGARVHVERTNRPRASYALNVCFVMLVPAAFGERKREGADKGKEESFRPFRGREPQVDGARGSHGNVYVVASPSAGVFATTAAANVSLCDRKLSTSVCNSVGLFLICSILSANVVSS